MNLSVCAAPVKLATNERKVMAVPHRTACRTSFARSKGASAGGRPSYSCPVPGVRRPGACGPWLGQSCL